MLHQQVVEYEEGGLYELHTDAFPFAGTLPEDRQPMLGGQVCALDWCVCVFARVGMRVCLCLPCHGGCRAGRDGARCTWKSANVSWGMGLRRRTERRRTERIQRQQRQLT